MRNSLKRATPYTTIRQNFVFFVRFYCLYSGFWSFEFVSDFEFRISNFLAAAPPRQTIHGAHRVDNQKPPPKPASPERPEASSPPRPRSAIAAARRRERFGAAGRPAGNKHPHREKYAKTYLLLIKRLTQRRLHLIIKESDLKKPRGKHLMTFENAKVYENHGAFLGEINRTEGTGRRGGFY